MKWPGPERRPSADDEWIELWNPGSESIPLDGWVLTDGNDIEIRFGRIHRAGRIFSSRARRRRHGERYSRKSDLYRRAFEFRRGAAPPGSGRKHHRQRGRRTWPAGAASPLYASMERATIDPPAWMTNTGWIINGRDARGGPIRGTPGRPNSALFPTPSPTKIPRGVLINEFVPKPGSDWNHDGSVDYYDEFIELLNTNSIPIDLGGWMLDDRVERGQPSVHDPSRNGDPSERVPGVLPQPDASRAQRRGRRGVVAGAGRPRGGWHALHPHALARQRLGPLPGRGRQTAARFPADAGGTEPPAARPAESESRAAGCDRRGMARGGLRLQRRDRSRSAEDFSPPAGKNRSGWRNPTDGLRGGTENATPGRRRASSAGRRIP